jgi:hypothetical protein
MNFAGFVWGNGLNIINQQEEITNVIYLSRKKKMIISKYNKSIRKK